MEVNTEDMVYTMLITEKCRGKIIFKNTSIDNVNYLNIGVLIP